MGPIIGDKPGPIDYKDVLSRAKAAGVSRRSADRFLSRLVDSGRISHGGRGEYHLLEKKEK